MSGMPRRARVVTWNGKDVPPELRELPAGRYVVEAVEDEVPVLSPEEEAGIEAALESYREGRVVDAKPAREIIDATLGVEGHLHRRGRRGHRRRDRLSQTNAINRRRQLDADIARCIERLVCTGSDRQTSTAGSKSTEGVAHPTPEHDPMCNPRT